MAVSPTGILSRPLANLRTAFAAVPFLSTWIEEIDGEEPDAATILSHIALVAADEATLPDPCIVIYTSPDFFDSGGLEQEGALGVRIAARIPTAYQADEADAQLDFLNHCGALMEGLMDLSRSGAGHTHIRHWATTRPPPPSHEGELGKARYRLDLTVAWGLERR